MVPKPGRWKSASVVNSRWKVLVSWAMPPVMMRIVASRTTPHRGGSSDRMAYDLPATQAWVVERLELVPEKVHSQDRQRQRETGKEHGPRSNFHVRLAIAEE